MANSLFHLGTWRDELVPLEQLELREPPLQPRNPGSSDFPHLTGTPSFLVHRYFLVLGMNRISNWPEIRQQGFDNRPNIR